MSCSTVMVGIGGAAIGAAVGSGRLDITAASPSVSEGAAGIARGATAGIIVIIGIG
jgi:hypothetical protein